VLHIFESCVETACHLSLHAAGIGCVTEGPACRLCPREPTCRLCHRGARVSAVSQSSDMSAVSPRGPCVGCVPELRHVGCVTEGPAYRLCPREPTCRLCHRGARVSAVSQRADMSAVSPRGRRIGCVSNCVVCRFSMVDDVPSPLPVKQRVFMSAVWFINCVVCRFSMVDDVPSLLPVKQRVFMSAVWFINCVVCRFSMVNDVPPPLPVKQRVFMSAVWFINCVVCRFSMVDDVPPPLPVKQRANSVMSDRCSVSRMYSRDDDKSVRKSSTVSSDDDGLSTVSPRSVSSQRHMTTEFTSSLDSVLAELNEAAAPKKPPLNVRILSYDNSTSCEDAIDGRCVMRLTSRHDLTVAGPQSARRSQTSSDGMSQNHTVSSDGMSEYFVSSGHEMSHAVNSRVSEMTCRVVSSTVSFDRQTAASVPTTTTTCTSTAAPPLPMKLKHSTSSCLICYIHSSCHDFNIVISPTSHMN